MTDLSVVICTHDRYDSLADSVGALVNSRGFDDPRCELLVVDNTPASKRREFKLAGAKRTRLTICETQGLSHARNHAIAQSEGSVIAFLDDDALVSDDWCTTIIERMADESDALVLGGRVAPLYAGEKLPTWYGEDLSGYLSCIDWGVTPRYLRDGEWVVGANIAFRRQVFETYGNFDATLGRKGASSLLSNEETALLERLGLHRVFYDPKMAVQHVIPVERLTTRWFRRRVYWQAISDLIAGNIRSDNTAHRREYGDVVMQIEARHRNLDALTYEPETYDAFRLQLRAVYLAAIVLGHGGTAD